MTSTPEKIAAVLLQDLSPSGTLLEIADKNTELDKLIEHFDADEAAIAQVQQPSLIARLEDDFAKCVPALADAAVPLENWAIPLLSALVGPGAPFMSFGLTIACKVAILALKSWAAKRTGKPIP